MITRRGLIGGLASLLAAPAIVKATSLMPIKAMPQGHVVLPWPALGEEWVDYKFGGNALIRVQYRIIQATDAMTRERGLIVPPAPDAAVVQAA